ncbi:hypothetical protein GOP47_0017529 [Adiantum capillus-veneris]|uniref:Uncharacterized protein n=1 Tax=Adiantum capillus-veneris TaxID=13818 RepID=A0A9D4ZBV4_ADICA|nr:hypothetical protein GOP47_0017529 [Adiantum capillus-veneris]
MAWPRPMIWALRDLTPPMWLKPQPPALNLIFVVAISVLISGCEGYQSFPFDLHHEPIYTAYPHNSYKS